MSRARAIRDLARAASAPSPSPMGYAMGGSVEADDVNPNFAGDEGMTAMDRSLSEVAAPPLMLASGGQATTNAAPQRSWLDTLERQESGGNPNARNPYSSASGPFQFIDQTWGAFTGANPQLFEGMSPRQVAAARFDPRFSRLGAEWYAGVNRDILTRAGLPDTNANLALSHYLGGQGARRVLQGDPESPVASTLPNGARVVTANPNLRGVTNAQLIEDYARRYGGTAPLAPAEAGAPPMAAPAQASERPLPFPPPPTPPVPPMPQQRPAAPAPRRRDTGGLRRAMSMMDYQGGGESPTGALENHMRMVQAAQRRFAAPSATMAEGGLARANGGLAETLGAMGRGNDSLVAHITPREALMLKALGGSGTMNPYTGMLEFDDGGGAGDGGGGGSAGESGPGAGDGPSGAGGGGGSAGEGSGSSGGVGDGGGGGSAGESGPGAGDGPSGAGGGGGGVGEGGPAGEAGGDAPGTGGGAGAGDAGGRRWGRRLCGIVLPRRLLARADDRRASDHDAD
jgi:hypothetical protein